MAQMGPNGMYGMANMSVSAPQFQHPAMTMASPMTTIPQHALQQATQAAIPGIRPGMNPYGLSPMLYWYPSPPVSPQSTYYVHANPTTVILKGLPLTITAQELLAYFDGVFEVRIFNRRRYYSQFGFFTTIRRILFIHRKSIIIVRLRQYNFGNFLVLCNNRIGLGL
jgi:hypothetical protein